MHYLLILAAHSERVDPSAGGKGMSLSWAIVLLGVILGVAITLMPPKRTTEIKREKEE